jgi:phosphotransferase system  glucose/maltose/N-acetylglucosamine-specific IIC component
VSLSKPPLRRVRELLVAGSSLLLCNGCASAERVLRSASELVIGFVFLPLVVLGLLWFLYAVFLRKLVRARNIRVLRERRLREELVRRSREME